VPNAPNFSLHPFSPRRDITLRSPLQHNTHSPLLFYGIFKYKKSHEHTSHHLTYNLLSPAFHTTSRPHQVRPHRLSALGLALSRSPSRRNVSPSPTNQRPQPSNSGLVKSNAAAYYPILSHPPRSPLQQNRTSESLTDLFRGPDWLRL
jgi:hypothetical protein